MKIRMLVVGRCREAWLRAGIAEYEKRLRRYVTLEWIEVPDAPDSLPLPRLLAKEGEALLARIREGDWVILADLHGADCDSETFARRMRGWLDANGGQVTWVIGGSNGFDPRVAARADARIRLSGLTFPHLLTRLVLLEQIYRGFKLEAGEPYHK